MADVCKHLMRGAPDCVFCDRDRLRVALKGLSDMYARTWDRADGALVMMPDSVPRFEQAHRAALIALGEPVYDIDEQSSEQHSAEDGQ